MAKNPFDLSGISTGGIKMDMDWAKVPKLPVGKIFKDSVKLGRTIAARRAYKEVLASHGPEVAEAAANAVQNGRPYDHILVQADRRKAEQDERRRQVATPPPLHGSARWASLPDMRQVLRDRADCDNPRSILLGKIEERPGQTAGFVHWDGDGHLMTLAPTRSGKAVTTIIPNLLRYGGSCVVLDPKGELYEETSRYRATLGPVYRFAPFSADSGWACADALAHGFNPVAHVRNFRDARQLAAKLFPSDPRSQAFFNKDVMAFVAALIVFLRTKAPPHRQNLASVVQMTGLPPDEFRRVVLDAMRLCPVQEVQRAANNVLGKFGGSGQSLKNLADSLNADLALWGDPEVLGATRTNDIDFRTLKDRPATVYVQVPLELLRDYAPVVRVVLQSALDGMLRNAAKPAIPVLFVLDEFLALGAFPEFRDAVRTHASFGVRLWFFLQDLGTLQDLYPGTGWQSFFNMGVRQYFGTDEPFTAELIGKAIGSRTLGYLSTSDSANVSSSAGGENASAGFNSSTSESVNFIGKPLLTPEEVMQELSAWRADSSRGSILQLRDPPVPIRARLLPFDQLRHCQERKGMQPPVSGQSTI